MAQPEGEWQLCALEGGVGCSEVRLDVQGQGLSNHE